MANKKAIRLPDKLFTRDTAQEKEFGITNLNLYGYWKGDSSLSIIGQIIAPKLKEKCCLICSIYDSDGDVIKSSENASYGSGLVTSMIVPEAFFNGFPFKFNFYGVPKSKVKEIKIVLSDSY